METIAITYWNGIVSPLYDASCCLMVIRKDGRSKLIDVRSMTLFEKANICSSEGVTVLICGAISTTGCRILFNKDIKVIPWIRGVVSEIICAYKSGENLTVSFLMPGCYRVKCHKRRCSRGVCLC